MSWLFYAGAAAIMLGVHQVTFRSLGEHYPASYAALAYTPFLLLAMAPWAILTAQNGMKFSLTFPAVYAALVTGVTGALFIFLWTRATQSTANIGMISMVANGGSILIATMISVVIYAEPLPLQKIIGIIVGLFGIGLVILA